MSAALGPTVSDETSRLASFAEYFGRVIAPAVGLTYFLGFLVVNFHLQRYGTTFLGVFAPQYLTAGMWALYPFLAGLGLSAFAQEPLRWNRNPERWRRRLTNIWLASCVVLGFVLAIVGPLMFIVFDGPKADDRGRLVTLLILAAWSCAALFGLWIGQPSRPSEHPAPRGFRIYLFYGLLALTIVVIYCRIFVLAYRTVPAAWGGGREVKARLWIEPSLISRISGLGGFAVDSTEVAVHLVLVTEDMLIVVPPDSLGPAVVLKQQDVRGIILEQRARKDQRAAPSEQSEP